MYHIIPVSYYSCILLSLCPVIPVILVYWYPVISGSNAPCYTIIPCIRICMYPTIPEFYFFCILYPCILFQWGAWAGKTNIRLILLKPGIFTQQTLLDKQTNIFIYYYFSISRLNRTWNYNIKNFSFFPIKDPSSIYSNIGYRNIYPVTNVNQEYANTVIETLALALKINRFSLQEFFTKS